MIVRLGDMGAAVLASKAYVPSEDPEYYKGVLSEINSALETGSNLTTLDRTLLKSAGSIAAKKIDATIAAKASKEEQELRTQAAEASKAIDAQKAAESLAIATAARAETLKKVAIVGGVGIVLLMLLAKKKATL